MNDWMLVISVSEACFPKQKCCRRHDLSTWPQRERDMTGPISSLLRTLSPPFFLCAYLTFVRGRCPGGLMTPRCRTTRHPFANTPIIFQLLETLPGKISVTAGLAVLPCGGEEVNSQSHSSWCVFKRRQGTPEPASHGANQLEIPPTRSQIRAPVYALNLPRPPLWQTCLYVSQWTYGLLECLLMSALCARIPASSWVCLRTNLLSRRMISEVSDRARGFDGSHSQCVLPKHKAEMRHPDGMGRPAALWVFFFLKRPTLATLSNPTGLGQLARTEPQTDPLATRASQILYQSLQKQARETDFML